MTDPTKRGPGRPPKTPIISKSPGASEPMEHNVGQDHPRAMSSTGPASESLEPAYIEVVDNPVDQDKLDELVFMEEMLSIFIHEDPDENADPMPMVGNGGDRNIVYLKRGIEQSVKRKYVEVLARAKLTKYSQKRIVDGNGIEKYIQVPRTSLRIPFSVTEDPSGRKGVDWLRGVLAEA